MQFFDLTKYTKGDITGIRFVFLWLFSVTLTHNSNNGSHLNIGVGITPFEISTQLSIWSING